MDVSGRQGFTPTILIKKSKRSESPGLFCTSQRDEGDERRGRRFEAASVARLGGSNPGGAAVTEAERQ